MTRLAILTSQIGHYHDARYRGASEQIDDLVVIVGENEGGFAEFTVEASDGYSVERLFESSAAFMQGLAEGVLQERMDECLNRVRPDVIAIPGWSSPLSAAAIKWAHGQSVPLIVMSESQIDDADRSKVREWTKKRIVSLCDAALVGGPPHADYIKILGMAEDRIFLGYNAVGNSHFAKLATEARSNAGALRAEHNLPERYILASARFIAKKNLPNLVRAFARARSAVGGDSPDLVILGDGEERANIETAARDAGVADHVHLPGYRGYDVLPIFYGLSEGFAHVSTVEQWGLVVNEGMAAGLPVTVSEPCGVGRTVVTDGESGFIVEPTVEGIAEAIEKLFRMSDAERAAMGERAAAAIADWGPERFGKNMANAAQAALKHSRRRKLGLLDRIILDKLSERKIDAVS
ncbi:glycosyltransferase [Aurantiacibacter sp. MUD61]|uniref:glycosyltransferase n=1 Tax=Aurantiacibacter sp. MUD61 TaxID=3009083 RepID=UPI0022F11234|nr:glycosyltransferase [Aurantiacibacter sp. MUD61]